MTEDALASPRRHTEATPFGANIGAVAYRLLLGVVTLFGLLILTFYIGRIMPVDPVLLIVGDSADQATYERVHAELGLDRPLWEQFARYLGSLLHGDLGNSIVTGSSVLHDIATVLPATIELALFAFIIAIAIGIPAGVLAAVRRGRAADQIVRVVGLIGYSAPSFWLCLMGLMLFYATLHLLPGPGRVDIGYSYSMPPGTGFFIIDSIAAGDWTLLGNVLGHLVMPAIILGYGSAAYISRMTRAFMLEQLGQDYIITARVKGVSPMRIIWVHAFKSILVQLITVIALVFAAQLEGSVLVETVFAWPGFGRYLVTAMIAGDMNAVLGCVLLIGILFIAVNTITDIAYRYLDPRTK